MATRAGLLAAALALALLAGAARGQGSAGVLVVQDSPTCSRDEKGCPLGVHVQSFLDGPTAMKVRS